MKPRTWTARPPREKPSEFIDRVDDLLADNARSCPHGDPACPCPDGLACHYENDPASGTEAWPCAHCGTTS